MSAITTPGQKLDTIKVSDIADGKVCAACGNCGDVIDATRDDDGIWIECACDAGYADGNIRAIKMW